MSGKVDASAGGADGSQDPCQLANCGRMYRRSASWLYSRTSLPLLNPDIEQVGLESKGVLNQMELVEFCTVFELTISDSPDILKNYLTKLGSNLCPDWKGINTAPLDSPSEDITSILYDVFDYFEEVREQHGRVFVHCYQGVSRSTSLVISYLMWREGQSFDDTFEYVKSARGIADPNISFACQLLQCQKKVHAFPLSPSSLLRMYRVAPHSLYDPLHLIMKILDDPSPSTLDHGNHAPNSYDQSNAEETQ
ncbi:Protein-tyrosine-phosphatase MKP1 [Capsicum baccatum]|uniref:Protein-tyrosine-phosphatase MKP1 n=1 Tax=Capsicum baccatum TaxID=33114 RepID=A0A2G2WV71_CAPBA|nr:Protein-tyrosine-phosphatase MKP1 [Capsicum baccatum]